MPLAEAFQQQSQDRNNGHRLTNKRSKAIQNHNIN